MSRANAVGRDLSGARALAFYLPQFHPIPENDAWWGAGFTEWTNVVQGTPLFEGHDQPHLPADLGFYDLRMPEIREAQASLARAHGISGFVYHHYWFAGRRLLERPFDEVLASGRPDFPFALCWANESWTRHWDGRAQDLLIAQEYGDEELERHGAWLAEAFSDPRYIRVAGRPLFVIYSVHGLPGPPGDYAKRLKDACMRHGSPEPYLVQIETYITDRPPSENGCDAEVEFHPHRTFELAPRVGHEENRCRAAVFHYADLVQGHAGRDAPPWTRYPCVVPRWDNSPRLGDSTRAIILTGSNPDLYEGWLRDVAERETGRDGGGLVFINSWNEWAEGAHLEPDRRHRRGYLEATRAVFGAGGEPPPAASEAPAASSRDPQHAYAELYARYVEAQRGREHDIRRGESAAKATVADLERRLAEREETARVLEAWAQGERRVRLEAEAWAQAERRARLETDATRNGHQRAATRSNGWPRRLARGLGLGVLRRG